jgi:hypothetical protein
MKIYRITLEVDEAWYQAIINLTDVEKYEGETCRWVEEKEITNA